RRARCRDPPLRSSLAAAQSSRRRVARGGCRATFHGVECGMWNPVRRPARPKCPCCNGPNVECGTWSAKEDPMRLRRALIVLPLVLAATPAAAQQSDEQAVIAVVQKLFDGMRARDTVMMNSTFAPGAQLLGISQRDGTESLRAVPA